MPGRTFTREFKLEIVRQRRSAATGLLDREDWHWRGDECGEECGDR